MCFGKYACVVPLKHKKGITITNASQKNLNKSSRKPTKILLGRDSEFYNRSMKSWLQGSDTDIYLVHKWKKICSCWRFITTLKNKAYKYMTSISKNVCIDKLDDIVGEY